MILDDREGQSSCSLASEDIIIEVVGESLDCSAEFSGPTKIPVGDDNECSANFTSDGSFIFEATCHDPVNDNPCQDTTVERLVAVGEPDCNGTISGPVEIVEGTPRTFELEFSNSIAQPQIGWSVSPLATISTDNIERPIITFPSPGTYTITATLVDSHVDAPCPETIVELVVIVTRPTANCTSKVRPPPPSTSELTTRLFLAMVGESLRTYSGTLSLRPLLPWMRIMKGSESPSPPPTLK